MTVTLSAGRPAVTGIVNLADDESIRGYLRLVASVERFSQHPMAKAIVEYASALNIELADVTDFVSRPGRGVRGRVEGHDVAVGGEAMLRESQVEILGHRESDGDGPTSILAAVDGRIVLSIAVSDPLRDGAPEAIAELRKLGLSVAMLTGDRTESAREVATKTGIADVLVGMSPEDKLAEVRRRRSAGRKVGYAGDGINDAPALLAADVGITFGSATDVAKGAAAITIVHSRLDRLPLLIRLARRSVRIIRQNLFWAFAYNLAALPLAATGHVPPGIAAGAMMFSSLSVVLNSLRLRNRTPRS
jgi:Cu+-exporting ATPase